MKNALKITWVCIGMFIFCLADAKKIKAHKKGANYSIPQITVDCSSTPVSVKSMTGFLHSVNPVTPNAKYINSLKPAFWRLSSQNPLVRSRVLASGATPIIIVSDIYHYPGERKANWRKPLEDKVSWGAVVSNIFSDVRKINNTAIYDIWNEPNGSFYWSDKQADFFNIFKQGHDNIRAMPGGDSALICGPSISKFDPSYLTKFLEYCLANKITLDVLSWHEFRKSDGLAAMANDIKWARAKFLQNKKYAPLKIKKIFIPEIISKDDNLEPAAVIAYDYYLESAGVDGACKSCWVESDGKSNCFNNSLDGLLDAKTNLPRSIWWAYYYYANSVSKRLKCNVNTSALTPFVNIIDSNKQVQMLLAYYGDSKTNASEVDNVSISLNNIGAINFFSGKRQLNIKVLEIPSSGEGTLDAPVLIYNTNGNIVNGNLNYIMPRVELNKVYVLQFM